jgi:mannose-6-phosphate isomerase
MLLLHNTIQRYAWGRRNGMAELVGSEPTGGPEAELWVGAHPVAPSRVVDDPNGRTLAEVIAADPERWLGPDLVARGVTTLPFLLKVLAIGTPLSLQAHPSRDEARAGFRREEEAGIPRDAPERTYRDANAKPEALVALTDTWALCGFRTPQEAAHLLEPLGVAVLDPLRTVLVGGSGSALADALSWVLHLDGSERVAVAQAVATAARRCSSGAGSDPYHWVVELARHHPGDPGCLAPILLHVLHLAPDEAVHLPAGNLHAYLCGAGVELMAASDNVLRGGLTPKHIDVDELLQVLRFDPGVPTPPVRAHPAPDLTTYDCGEDDFGLVAVDPSPAGTTISPRGPSLLLATGGPVRVLGPSGPVSIHGGAAAFVPPGHGELTVTGPGRLWWATVGRPLPV